MKATWRWIGLCVFLIGIRAAGAESGVPVETTVIEYRTNGVVFLGYAAFPAGLDEERPGILVFPEWWGLNDYARRRAQQLAALGYVALAVDLYGEGRVAQDSREAAALAGVLKAGGRVELQQRAAAALAALKYLDFVDTDQVAAIGYCFGGTAALELARSGADLRGLVSFHGGLDTPHPARPGVIRPALLVCHGADDPTMSKAVVDAFEAEMRQAGADWQMILYGGAVHSFTNPQSGNDKSKGVAYNAKADYRSWALMRLFFCELFPGVDIDPIVSTPAPAATVRAPRSGL